MRFVPHFNAVDRSLDNTAASGLIPLPEYNRLCEAAKQAVARHVNLPLFKRQTLNAPNVVETVAGPGPDLQWEYESNPRYLGFIF